jgi:phosphatidate cytidylyltransferase
MEDKSKEKKKKEPVTLRKVMIRTITACILTILFLMMLQAGHLYCMVVGVLTQTELYRELVNIRYVEAQERDMPLFRTLQWSWFVVAMVQVYGENLHDFASEQPKLYHILPVTKTISELGFVLYCVVFIASVLTLKKELLRFQISQFMWSIITICLVVFQCKFFATNILKGLFWFFFPMATVVMNDVSAYFVGISIGRKFIDMPLLPLSPNKTWEGFIGAAFLTVIFSFFFPLILVQFSWFTCPANNLYLSMFPPALECTPPPIFTDVWGTYSIPFIESLRSIWTFTPIPSTVDVLRIQVHGIYYGLFASLVAPFGGFFASAIKRAYGKKDFESFFPGHGGMMDRMDCQLLMMAFTSFHYATFVAPSPSLHRMEFLVSLMTPDDQVALMKMLQEITSSTNRTAIEVLEAASQATQTISEGVGSIAEPVAEGVAEAMRETAQIASASVVDGTGEVAEAAVEVMGVLAS